VNYRRQFRMTREIIDRFVGAFRPELKHLTQLEIDLRVADARREVEDALGHELGVAYDEGKEDRIDED
jgi:hypothetical protein